MDRLRLDAGFQGRPLLPHPDLPRWTSMWVYISIGWRLLGAGFHCTLYGAQAYAKALSSLAER